MAEHDPIQILDAAQMEQKINRLAYQIYENNFDEQELLVCGIAERGYLLAQKIHNKLREITPLQLSLVSVRIDKDNPNSSNLALDPSPDMAGKSVILCDDVLYTGKTLAYAAIPFLQADVKKLHCLVLIQRNHLSFPVQPTYVGMSLATTLQEHVLVNLKDDMSAYIS